MMPWAAGSPCVCSKVGVVGFFSPGYIRAMKHLAALMLAFATFAAQAAGPAWPGAQWDTATPEAEGMDSSRVREIVDFGALNRIDAVVLVRHGRLVAEAYYAPFRAGMKHRINSTTKAVTVALTGIAQSQGLLPGFDAPALALLGLPPAADARKNAITLQHLADLSAGIAWEEALTGGEPVSLLAMQRAPDWKAYVLEQPMARAPGEAFSYNSGATHLLSVVLARATNSNTRDYAARELFAPLGITDWRWRSDPQGIAAGGWGLYLQPRDMARIGYLFLRGGEWNGRQLVPRAVVDHAFKPVLPMNLFPGTDWRYANGWWALPQRDAYIAMGYMRQMILVMPKHDLVAVTVSRSMFSVEQLLDRIDAAVKSAEALPPDAASQASLAQRIAAMAREETRAEPVPPLAAAISGRTWKFDANPLRLRELVLRLGDAPGYEASRTGASGNEIRERGAFGRDGGFGGDEDRVARYRWRDERTLALEVREPGEALAMDYLLRFDGDRVDVEYANNYGMKARFSGRAR